MSEVKHTPGPAYAAEAYMACLYGRADAQQQRSVASALILANGHKGELLRALKAVVSVADRQTVEFDLARSAISAAEGRDHGKGEGE